MVFPVFLISTLNLFFIHFQCTVESKRRLVKAAVELEHLPHIDVRQSSLCSCCRFHFTPKLVIYLYVSCLLPLLWSLAAEASWITQWRPMGGGSQTVLSCYSKHSHCEWKVIKPGNTKRACSLTAFNWFVIKTLSLDGSWGHIFHCVTF